MKRLLLLFISLFLVSTLSAQSNVYLSGDFTTVYNKAKSEKKKLFVSLDYADKGNTPSVLLFNGLKSAKITEKYNDNYVFFKCNVQSGNNVYIRQILLFKNYPTFCIFDESGTLIYVDEELTPTVDGVKKVIANVSKGVKYHSPTTMFGIKDNKKLLEMLDCTIKANLKYLKGQNGLTDINKAIFIEKNFYNLYLKYKILMKQGNLSLAQKIKEEAKVNVRPGHQFNMHKELIYELNGKKLK